MSVDYKTYLDSPEWRERRQLALRYAGERCQLCNSPRQLDVHHRTYERLGEEFMADLTVLCRRCHDALRDIVDPARVIARDRRRRRQAVKAARRDAESERLQAEIDALPRRTA